MRRAALLGAMLLVASLIAGIPASAAKPTRLRVVEARGTDAPALVTGIEAPVRVGSAPRVARDYLSDSTARYRISDPERELTLLDVLAHEGGRTVRFQQLHRGVPVFGANYLVHLDESDDGRRVTMVNGDFFTDLDVPVEPRLSPADARSAAFADIRTLSHGRADDHGLVVLPVGDGVLAYHLTIVGESLGTPLRQQVLVNAATGSVVLRYNDIKTAGPVLGSGVSVKDPGPTLPLGLFQRVDGIFEMRDLVPPPPSPAPAPPPVEIVTHDAEDKHGGTFDPDKTPNIVESLSSTFPEEATESGAVDAHWGARQVFDFYASLGRNSLDGEGIPIVSVVNASDRGDPLYNASWNGEHITFGNPEPGDDGELYPMSAALDIVAHELTHGVNEFAVDFVYLSQSGALDEAYADYFGNAVEVKAEGTNMSSPTAGRIAEDVCKVEETTSGEWTCPFLRDLNDGRGTDDYLYYLYDFDNGGVHDNATIYAGALWEIRQDLAARDYNPMLADRIIYRALTSHAPLDSFFDGRLLVEAAAQEIGLEELTLAQRTQVNNIVDDAFDDRSINADWDSGTDNDTLVLLEDTNPQGFAPSVPRVSGQRFVTVHYPDLTDFCCGPGQLFMGDVTGGDPKQLTVSDNDQADEQPDIGGGVIVWSRFSDGDRDVIATKKGSTKKLRTVAGGSAFEWYPSVDGNLVAWENRTSSQTDIYARYGRGRVRKLTQTSGNEINPQVTGNTVAWWNLRRQVPRIGITNLKTGRRATIKLSRSRSSAMIGPPAVTSKYVFWYQDGNGDGRGAIMRANHKGKKKKTVVAANSGFAPVWTNRVAEVPRPSANNTWVAYTSEAGFLEDQAIPSDEVGRDIFLVRTGGGTPEPVTCNRGDQAHPDVGKGQRTVWFDASRGQTDLVTWRSPPAAPCG